MMEWAIWKPLYHDILRDMGYDPKADIEAAHVLADLYKGRDVPSFSTIVDIINKHVSIFGASNSLECDIDNLSGDDTIISAGSATSRLMRKGILPDVIVTDLDGENEYEIEASCKGVIVFILAHGDNIDKIRRAVPLMKGPIVPTVQCQPFGVLYNFGGFTDGDRSYLIAKHFGAERIQFFGWDLDDAYPKKGSDLSIKNKKMMWAKKIINDF